jgi:hypothetical protein
MKKMVVSFEKYFIKLPNNFVVFNEKYIKSIINNMHSVDVLKKVIKKISLELSGES